MHCALYQWHRHSMFRSMETLQPDPEKFLELANYRMGKIQETLDRLVLESDRIKVHQLAINEYGQIPDLLSEFMEKMEEVGPNPYKGW